MSHRPLPSTVSISVAPSRTRLAGMGLVCSLSLLAAASGCRHDNGASANRDGPKSAFESSPKDPPINADTHYAAGQLAEAHNATPQAALQYEQALRRNPHHLGAMYRLAVTYAQLQEYPKAVAMWERYIGETHGSATSYSNLGFCQEL